MKTSFENSAWCHVKDSLQAQMLHSAEDFRFFHPFFAQENTVSQAAKSIGVSVLKMYRKVRQLEAVGLLIQTHLEPRAGKPIKYYRSVAERFFIPNQLLLTDDFESLLLEEDDVWRRKLLRGMAQVATDAMRQQGTYIFREDQGRIRKVNHSATNFDQMPEDITTSSNGVWSDWSLLCLEPNEAQALRGELQALYHKYFHKSQQRGHFFVVRTALAPLAHEDIITFGL